MRVPHLGAISLPDRERATIRPKPELEEVARWRPARTAASGPTSGDFARPVRPVEVPENWPMRTRVWQRHFASRRAMQFVRELLSITDAYRS